MKFLKGWAQNAPMSIAFLIGPAFANAVELEDARFVDAEQHTIYDAENPSIGSYFDPVFGQTTYLYYRDLATGEPTIQKLPPTQWDPPEHALKNPQQDVEVEDCIWGDGILFCQTSQEVVLPPPFPPVMRVDAVYARDFVEDEEYILMLPNGFVSPGPGSILRDAHGSSVVVESSDGTVLLVELEDKQLVQRQVVAGEGYPRSPVVGPGYLGETHVVYKHEDPHGVWNLRAWRWDKTLPVPAGRVVAFTEAGSVEPNPSDFLGLVYLNGGNPLKVRSWTPFPQLEPGQPPYPILDTVLDPALHLCDSLMDAKIGPYFALVRGERCGVNNDESRLFAVTMFGNQIHHHLGLYQPLRVTDIGESFGTYVVANDWLAYTQNDDIVVTRGNLSWLQHTTTWNVRTLTPWNLPASGNGSIDYAGGEKSETWTLRLSRKQTYRIAVLTPNFCQNWYNEARFILSGPNFSSGFVTHNEPGDWSYPPNCPVFDLVAAGEDPAIFTLEIDRAEAGLPGVAPPLEYSIYITPL